MVIYRYFMTVVCCLFNNSLQFYLSKRFFKNMYLIRELHEIRVAIW